MKEQKKVYLEWMRIVAVILVIFNHLPGYLYFQETTGGSQVICMTLTMLTRINVPLFLMISGSLLLGKKEDYLTVFKKRISRYLVVITVFSFITYLVYCICDYLWGNGLHFSIGKFAYGVLTNNLEGTGPYWYLYCYLGFLCMLPFLQKIVRDISKTDVYVLMGIHFLFSSLIPGMNVLIGCFTDRIIELPGAFEIPLSVSKAIFYPIVGYYLEYKVNVKDIKRSESFTLLASAIIGILIECFCTLREGIMTGSYTQNYVQMFDYVLAVGTFVLIKKMVVCWFPKLSEEKISLVISLLGSLTFGIYLFDQIIKHILWTPFISKLQYRLSDMVISVIWIFISMVLGGLLTWVCKRIPGIKKIL